MAKIDLFSLGEIYPSDFLKTDEKPHFPPVELKLVMDNNGTVHLDKTAPKEAMWGKYWYRSGGNQTMRDELKNIVDSILLLRKFEKDSVWLDIACNDGTLLSFVPNYFTKIGIDPAEDSFKEQAERYADIIIQDYFSAAQIKRLLPGVKVSVVTSIAMFYDLQEPKTFIDDVYEILEDDGLWVMQLSYSPLMLQQLAFDNIVHEHWAYYSLFTIRNLLLANRFKIMDCQLNDTNGGSFRLYLMKDIGDEAKFGSQPHRDVCRVRVESLLTYENFGNFNSGMAWTYFYEGIKLLKEQTVEFIKKEKGSGKTIWAYGASTKGNTLLQYFGLDNTLIAGIAERNPDKWGLRTIGTSIPIYSEEEMRKANPDYLLILPWHFIKEFKERESDYLKAGGCLIVPCPKFELIAK